MREFHERDADDRPDNESGGKPEHTPDSTSEARPDNRLDNGLADGGDSRRLGAVVVRDAATRKAMSLEYQQRIKAVYAAVGATDAAPAGARGDRGRDVPVSAERAASPSVNAGEQGGRYRADDSQPIDTAWQPTRGADLPANAWDLPEARDVLPNLKLAEIDERKFSEYSLNPGNPQNRGKAEGWRELGYDVDDPRARQQAASELRDLTLGELLMNGKVAAARDDSYGYRLRVISGITGPNGRNATLVTCWRIEDRSGTSVPRLITNWVQPHRDKETGQ